MTAPELDSGDSGDDVRQLQTRLQALGLYDGAVDGQFGDRTAASVSDLQARHELPADGRVDAPTWQAVAAAERLGGPPDQQWEWDGESWQPKDLSAEEPGAASAPAAAPEQDETQQFSADGQWLWDGDKWQPVET